MQAAFHAVPLVGIPLIADQLDNVMKAVHRGFGLAVSPKGGLRAADIDAALNMVLSEPSFKQAAVKLSKRLRSRTRTPAQEAAGKSPALHCCCTLLHTCLALWVPDGVHSCARNMLQAIDRVECIFLCNSCISAAYTQVAQQLVSTILHFADWIQHVLDTDGEPYLQTPEDDIPLVSLFLLDVLGFLLIASALPAVAAYWLLAKRWRGKERQKIKTT